MIPLLLILTPLICNDFGVAVEVGDTPTGIVVEEHQVTEQEIQAKCQSPFQKRRGCAIPVQPNEYIIYYVDNVAYFHERCHVLWEEPRHTLKD